jgi:hypothetical protein
LSLVSGKSPITDIRAGSCAAIFVTDLGRESICNIPRALDGTA